MPDERTDEELMLAAGEGDASAFDLIVGRHAQSLVNFFYRHTWSQSASEDLAQDCLFRVWQAASGYEPSAKFTTWLFRIARNLWIDNHRRLSREKPSVSIDSAMNSDGETWAGHLEDKDALSPDEVQSRTEIAGDLLNAIDSLSDEHKTVFLLSVLHGMKYQDIADALDLPLGTVKSRMCHSINRLRDLLSGSECDPEKREARTPRGTIAADKYRLPGAPLHDS